MARKASTHAKPCKIPQSEAHNRRTEEYMANIHKEKIYVRTDLSSLNEEWVSEEMKKYSGLQEYYDMIKVMVKQKTNRALQEKPRERRNRKTGKIETVEGSSPIKEDCVIIKEDTTMEEVFEYVRLCHEKWGLTALEIFIHRDEGHWEDPEAKTGWIPNPHAHVIWDWMDHETGKSLKLLPKDTSKMQDFAAQALGMERGISKELTGAEHLERNDYIIAKQKSEMKANEATKGEQAAEIERMMDIKDELSDNISRKQNQIDDLDQTRKEMFSDVAKLGMEKKQKTNQVKTLNEQCENLVEHLENLEGQRREKVENLEDLNERFKHKANEYDELDEKCRQKVKDINTAKGNQVLDRFGDLIGVGKTAEVRKDNKTLLERNKALENEVEGYRKHDAEVRQREAQIPQIVSAQVKKLLPQAVAKATAEKDKEITRLNQVIINDRNEKNQLEGTIKFYQRWSQELWSVLGRLAKAAMKALYDFAMRGCKWMSDSEEYAIKDYIGDDKNRRQYADDLKVYSRFLLPIETLSVIDYHIEDIHDKYAPNQDRSQGRGGIGKG